MTNGQHGIDRSVFFQRTVQGYQAHSQCHTTTTTCPQNLVITPNRNSAPTKEELLAPALGLPALVASGPFPLWICLLQTQGNRSHLCDAHCTGHSATLTTACMVRHSSLQSDDFPLLDTPRCVWPRSCPGARAASTRPLPRAGHQAAPESCPGARDRPRPGSPSCSPTKQSHRTLKRRPCLASRSHSWGRTSARPGRGTEDSSSENCEVAWRGEPQRRSSDLRARAEEVATWGSTGWGQFGDHGIQKVSLHPQANPSQERPSPRVFEDRIRTQNGHHGRLPMSSAGEDEAWRHPQRAGCPGLLCKWPGSICWSWPRGRPAAPSQGLGARGHQGRI